MLTLTERFAAEAGRLQFLEGTRLPMRFVEHGRDPSVGLDCVGHVLIAADRVGVHFEDRAYALVPGTDLWTPMLKEIGRHADPVEGEWERGDILAIRFDKMRNHLGVYLGRTLMVHASDKTGLRRVVVTPLDPAHRRMVKFAFRLREPQ